MKWWSDLSTNLAFCHPQPHTRHCCCRTFHPGCRKGCFFPPHQIWSHLNPHLLLCCLLRVGSTFVSFGSFNCSKKSSNGSLSASLSTFPCAWVVYSSSLSKSQNQILPHSYFVKCNIMRFLNFTPTMASVSGVTTCNVLHYDHLLVPFSRLSVTCWPLHIFVPCNDPKEQILFQIIELN